jgi:hypothetical protein
MTVRYAGGHPGVTRAVAQTAIDWDSSAPARSKSAIQVVATPTRPDDRFAEVDEVARRRRERPSRDL